jgi:ribosomal protein L24E
MANLSPLPGFDWKRVTWGRPDSPRSALCSYCSAVISDGDGEVPLIMWKNDGHAAQFCDVCQRKWWGLESFPDEDDD